MRARLLVGVATIVAAVTIGGAVASTAAAPPTIAGSGVVATAPVSLTLVPEGSGGVWFSVCAWHTWCTHSGPLWTLINRIACSAVVGNVWYGVIHLSSGMPNNVGWWTFKVVDNGPVGDRMGFVVTKTRGSGPCGASRVVTSPLHAGDFRPIR